MWDESSIFNYTDFMTKWNYYTNVDSHNGNAKKLNKSITGNVSINGNVSSINGNVSSNNTKITVNTTPIKTNDEWNQDKIDIFSIFSRSNIILLIWFLAIYVVLSFILNILYKTPNSDNTNLEIGLLTSRTFDMIIFILILFIIVVFYNDITQNLFINGLDTFINGLDAFGNYVDHKGSVLSSLLFIFVFYLFIYIFNISMYPDNKSIFITIIEVTAWIVFLICIFNLFFRTVFGFSIIDSFIRFINDLFDLLPDNDKDKSNVGGGTVKNDDKHEQIKHAEITHINTTPIVTKKNEPALNEEVFNISNNIYTYKEAAAVCNAYGARLANYDDVEESYNDGGEWCNYGWSNGQMIYFPTQKDTWDKLQHSDATKNSCGRPGINGGYMVNPYLKFGVNCYGVKPPAKDSDLQRMELQKHEIVAKSSEDIELDKKVKYWKQNADKMMNVNSFNNTKWSEY